MGLSALFRIKKLNWKKIKFRPRKKELNLLQRRVKLVEALEKKDKKKELLKLFGQAVNYNAYRTYEKLLTVAENKLLCNLQFKCQLISFIEKAGVNDGNQDLLPFPNKDIIRYQIT